MAGSPGSRASLEGISLDSSEEADLRREGREGLGDWRKSWPPTGFGASGEGALGTDFRETEGLVAQPTRKPGLGWGCQLPWLSPPSWLAGMGLSV